jgi:RecB family exonuclease
VDLKTGKRQPGKAEVARHPQLGAYQAAVLKGAFQDAGVPEARVGKPAKGFVPGGAVLAQLGTKTKSPAVQQQEPLDPADNWAETLVNEAASLMAGATFEARHDPGKSGHGGHGCRLAGYMPVVCQRKAGHRMTTELLDGCFRLRTSKESLTRFRPGTGRHPG